GNSEDDAAPDPWWRVDDSFCFVFEDHAHGKSNSVLSVRKARQAASHPEWIRAKLDLAENAVIVPVLITPCSTTTRGALPVLKSVRYWHLDDFREWAKHALRIIRELRREYPGAGNLNWRGIATQKLRAARIAPKELNEL